MPASGPMTYSEFFERCCPHYMAMGMTYDQYWHGDPWMTKAFREYDEIRRERENEMLWLQGMYVYEAICDVTPLLRTFSKVKKPVPYAAEPYPLTERMRELQEARKRKADSEKFKAQMNAWAAAVNKKFAQKQKEGGAVNGR